MVMCGPCLKKSPNQSIIYKQQLKMSQEQSNNQFIFTVKSPKNRSSSPNIANTPLTKKEVFEAKEKVGKHGKSHHLYLKIMNEHKSVAEMRKISSAQLAEHSNPDNAWLSYNGIVYDVSVYLGYHPGGQILLKGCGKESAELFHQYHPWVNAKALLQNYAIGYLSH